MCENVNMHLCPHILFSLTHTHSHKYMFHLLYLHVCKYVLAYMYVHVSSYRYNMC